MCVHACVVCVHIRLYILKKAYLPCRDVSLTPRGTAHENRKVRVDGKDHT